VKARTPTMLFNSYEFLLGFLPLALLIVAIADPYDRLRIPALIVLSLIFYSFPNLANLPILLLSILFNWIASVTFARTQRAVIVDAAIAADIALLGFFKYTNYAISNVNWLGGESISYLSILPPLGVSFFTFHHIMYLVDLRRARVEVSTLERYALYVCFFPQLIAGPLTRWSQVAGQFGRPVFRLGWEQRFVAGLTLIVVGLAEKVFLADSLAGLIGPVLARAQTVVVEDGSAWLTLGFGYQVFFDFAGYSDIAVGLGLLLGIELPQNFRAPFRATSIQDFWQRWHITLTLFLRDYVFLPLCDLRIGGRRHVFAAIIATMTLCGLWHGAGWNFVAWGALHGLALALTARWPQYAKPPIAVRRTATIAFFLLTAIFFAAGSLLAARHLFLGLFRLPSFGEVTAAWPVYIAALCAMAPPSREWCASFTERRARGAAVAAGLVAAAVLLRIGGTETYDFVYFQF
jgi:alginate O-acetyltransferase complex protein AlgI